MDLNEMRTRVRQDLHDEDASNYRWIDAVLDRHIQHALQEISMSAPLEALSTLTPTAGSRDLSLDSLTGLVQVEAVEYPTDKYPPSFVRFSVWADTLTLLVDSAPSGSESVNLYYGKLHTLDATTSTLLPALEELVALGAEGYAAIEWASFATNRINVGGEDTWRHYLTWGRERLAAFRRGLARRSSKSRVRNQALYTPIRPLESQTTDWGP